MTYEEREVATGKAFENPRAGDRYSEMLSYWMYVVAVNKKTIITMEASPPCTFPQDAKVRYFETREDFRYAYSYKTGTLGYWVLLEDRGNNVSGWLDDWKIPLELTESESK